MARLGQRQHVHRRAHKRLEPLVRRGRYGNTLHVDPQRVRAFDILVRAGQICLVRSHDHRTRGQIAVLLQLVHYRIEVLHRVVSSLPDDVDYVQQHTCALDVA